MSEEEQIMRYINNPNTKVWINYNDEAGIKQYSVQVSDTDFWLDSFKTIKQAQQFIADNNLKME